MDMRPSRVLRKLRAGEVVSCYKTNLADARVAEIAAICGFDCLWTCAEHVPLDWSAIQQQVWAAKTHDMDVMVRVARGSYSDHILPLELDAAGLMVPHVMSLADAKQVVRMTRFHPIGRRPLDGGNADGAYCNIAIADYLRQANEQRFICLQIEDPEPVPELEEIAALPGVDMLLFGPGDYSHALGIAGQFDDPRIVEMRKRVADVCRRHGKFAAAVGGPGNVQELVDMGYQFINMGSDVVGLSQQCTALVQAVAQVKR